MNVKAGDMVLLHRQTGSGHELKPAIVAKVTPTGRIRLKGHSRAWFNSEGILAASDLVFGTTYITKVTEAEMQAYKRKRFRIETYWSMLNVEPETLTYEKAVGVAKAMGWKLPEGETNEGSEDNSNGL